jgi:mRNA-degrading endonuclease RelE of RelBE toxin-antitoxin system
MMEVRLKKQPQKYLDSVDTATRKKLYKALNQLSRLEGNIVPLSGQKNRYRYKIAHYRIVFEWVKGEIIITVVEINTRTNIKY